jgi:hypothetical protein
MMSNSLMLGGDVNEVLDETTVTVGPVPTVTVVGALTFVFSAVGVCVAMTVAGPVKLQYRS